MRQTALVTLTAGALLVIGALTSPQAAAITAGAAPVGLRSAVTGTETVVRISCFRNGWRGWGMYPTCEKQVKKKRYKGMHKNK